MDQIRNFLEDWGLWTMLIVFFAKWITGILVAIRENEFKWYYLHEMLKSDGIAIATYAIIVGLSKYSGIDEFNNDYVQGVIGVALTTGLLAGLMKNIVHLLPDHFAARIPTTLREPARLRLGNPKNVD